MAMSLYVYFTNRHTLYSRDVRVVRKVAQHPIDLLKAQGFVYSQRYVVHPTVGVSIRHFLLLLFQYAFRHGFIEQFVMFDGELQQKLGAYTLYGILAYRFLVCFFVCLDVF